MMKLFDTNKGNRKPFFRILAFLLALAVILETLSLTAFSKGAAATYNNKYANQFSFLQEPDNSIQLAFVGDSNVYSGIVPAKLWTRQGFTSTIVAAPSQKLNQSYQLLQDLFEKQTPQAVVLETDMFYREKPLRGDDAVDTFNESLLDPFFDAMDPDNFEDLIKSAAPVFTFHDKWKNMLRKRQTLPKDAHSHGYHLNLTIRKFRKKDYMAPSAYAEPIRKKDREYIDKIIRLCRQHGAEVVFLTVPSPAYWSDERHNAVQQLADRYEITYIDYNLLWDELKLDTKKHFRDKGKHLNYYGAKIVSAHFADYIKKSLQMEPATDANICADWKESVILFHQDVVNMFSADEKVAVEDGEPAT